MPDPTPLKQRLFASIAQRYRSHHSKDLGDYIFSNSLFHEFDPGYADFLFGERRDIAAYLADPTEAAALVDYCIQSTRRFTHERNQYINFTEQFDGLIRSEYQDFLAQCKSLVETAQTRDELARSLGGILRRHHERLRLILATYCVITVPGELAENPLLQSVPCEEYSPEFQLQILGLDLDQILEPVLDVGCGADGRLVRFLRGRGLDAYGLDRAVPDESYFTQGDWFGFDYAARPWGTVLAHQSLSTHYVFNHLNNSVTAAEYASLFKKILAAIRPGGALVYAPGLPFFEEELEDSGMVRITRKPLAADFLGLGEIAYSARIALSF